MANEDTRRLLGECDAGIKMAVGSIDEVLSAVEDPKLLDALRASKRAHEYLGGQTQELLTRYDAGSKSPNAMAKSMSWLKTNMKLVMSPGDQSVADLMTDGCSMGVKSLHRYCNRYAGASADTIQLADRLIGEEERLMRDLQSYL